MRNARVCTAQDLATRYDIPCIIMVPIHIEDACKDP